jgi:phenylpropionate dioxygenase-like ring-hydroxylating dioxygenase large terminal subunit
MKSTAPRNCWYPLTWSSNVGRTLSCYKVLNTDLVVYRTQDGAVVALEDVCPHRLAPLSRGTLKGDTVQCGYHGMTFGANGRCVRIPSQSIIPPSAKVASYPVEERMGVAWIWMGDPERADPSQIFDLPQYHQAGWHAVQGDALRLEANYLNLADNLVDPAHVSFVHSATLGNSAGEEIPIEHAATDRGVLVWRWIKDAPAMPFLAKYGRFKGNVDRWQYYNYVAPSIAIIDFGSANVDSLPSPEDRDQGVRIFALHFITPVNDHACIDHWMHVRNFAVGDASVDQSMNADFRVAFNEDKGILEQIEVVERARPELTGLRLGIDAALLKMRRKVEQMAAADALQSNIQQAAPSSDSIRTAV